jgi:hypothetical protein
LDAISDSEDEDEECEDDIAFKPGEDSDEDFVSDGDPEPTEESAKFVWRAQSVWDHYKPKLLTDVSRVAYLCSANPHIIDHSQDTANSYPKTLLAVDQVIVRLILPTHPHTVDNKSEVLAGLIDTFWKEHEDFVHRRGYFAREHIWVSAGNDTTMAYDWHKRYSLPFTKVFGAVSCQVTASPLGIGQAEWNWKAVKANKSGKRSNLSPTKSKKQAVISASYSHKKSEARRMAAQRAGVLWTEEDFKFCKINSYCSAPIVAHLKSRQLRVFYAYKEDWEEVQFSSKGDDIHAARVSAKYGGLKYVDADKENQIGTFRLNDCAVLTKCRKNGPQKTQTKKSGSGLGYFYSILGVYEGFKEGLGYENQVESLYDFWERDWTFYEMIIDYYEKYPDPDVHIIKITETEKGEQGEEGSVSSNSDGS